MAKSLQHHQTALIARISPSGPAGAQPLPATAGSNHPYAIIYLCRWYKKSIRSLRRIATRYDKLARNYFSALCLVAAVAFWP